MSKEKRHTNIQGSRLGLSLTDTLISDKGKGTQFADVKSLYADVTITSAELLALNATPKTLVAAPGSGRVLLFDSLYVHKPAGTAYGGIAAGEDLVVKYTDGSGAQASSVIEGTGFLDQATAQQRHVGKPGTVTTAAGDVAAVANAALVLHLLVGEIITGDSDLLVRIWYKEISQILS